jgi:lipopolysaccharide biosynthesis protein
LSPRVRVVAQYFPQLHAIPENDDWWGKGFTDWDNVKRAEAQYPGHYQPRVPERRRYYDQSKVDTLRWQAELARAHGVDAFAHYHYWFDGKQLLQKPTDLLLANKDIDIQFCLTWANETWSRRWDGMDHHILIAQSHPPTVDSWGRHFDTLIKYWLDERALRIDGKPVFMIYRALKIPQIQWMFDYFQTRARRDYGLPGIFFVNVVQHHFPAWETLRHFDAAMLFQPFVATAYGAVKPTSAAREWWLPVADTAAKLLPRSPRETVRRELVRPTLFDYDDVWEEILAFHPGRHLPIFQGAFVDWDNTARYRNRATVFHGATPEKFGRSMKRLIDKLAAGPASERYVFINAWNEWAESAYLEPDERYGMSYLEALKRATGVATARSIGARPSVEA